MPGPSSTIRLAGGNARTQSARIRWLEPAKSLRTYRSAEEGGIPEPLLVQLEPDQHPEDGEAVADAAPEADLRGLVEVASGDGDLTEPNPLPHALRDDLGVEHEVVGVRFERHRLEVAAAVGAQAGVVLREEDVEGRVGHRGEEEIGEVLPLR